jgi:predicted deacylase
MNRTAGRAAHKLLIGQMPETWAAATELISALNHVRLCGTVQVITAAEAVVTATRALELNESKADRALRQVEAVTAARQPSLRRGREDLAYNPRFWQRKERRLLRQRRERR